jgi:hypothetical protein
LKEAEQNPPRRRFGRLRFHLRIRIGPAESIGEDKVKPPIVVKVSQLPPWEYWFCAAIAASVERMNVPLLWAR